jgi:DNA processing protein
VSATDVERRARRLLLHAAEPGDAVLHGFVAELGPVQAVDRLLAGSDPTRDGRIAARLARVDPARESARAQEVGARLVCPGDEEWPEERLTSLAVPPYALWVRGERRLADVVRRSAALVGSRASTAYGEHTATEIASGLADAGCTVVSGAAYGIDAAAHRGCLAVGGDTLAVLAGGVDDAYPRGHASLLARVAESGLVVSELPLLEHPTRSRFLERNRIIAALAQGVVAVEMALRSGASSTLEHAERLLRPVMAVPGPVGSAVSRGCHAWIRDHRAELVTDAADVLRLLEPLGTHDEALLRGERRRTDDLSADALEVFEALPPEGGTLLADLAASARLPAATVGEALRELVRSGLVDVVDDQALRAPLPRGGP